MLEYDTSFIERQFPVSKLSKESYKERKAGSNQTLTGLGKWWGRKPLILVRATILGLLLPNSNDPKKDRKIFLKLLSMDDNGLQLRKNKTIPIKILFQHASDKEKRELFQMEEGKYIPKYKSGIKAVSKSELQNKIYHRMTYDQKLVYCMRPEEMIQINDADWVEINSHLNTSASSIQELVAQLGEKRFGHTPKIGDCFSGGGSIPFEASRLGADVYASDLNPFAGLLTWSSLNILSKNDKEIEELNKFLNEVYDEVSKQVDQWGIEKNEHGWRAKYYLYCNETTCPDCNTKVPLIPNLVVSEGYKVVVKLILDEENSAYDLDVINNATKEEIQEGKNSGTVKNNALICPRCEQTTPITVLRRDKKYNGSTEYGLRKWEKDEFTSRPKDVFKERLYAIKYIDKYPERSWDEVYKKPAPATDSTYGKVYYVKPSDLDLKRESIVLELLSKRFTSWARKGFLPVSMIEDGEETLRLSRERGWKYWHQLFHPRQLLINGLFLEKANQLANNNEKKVLSLLAINGLANRNSKLMIWNYGYDKSEQTFANQALNTLFNFPVRTLSSIYSCWKFVLRNKNFSTQSTIELRDARTISTENDIWITDPPYADAVNYHELSEFFLAWDNGLKDIFPKWYMDSKRVLAVRGTGETFNGSMVEIYSNLAKNMSENGMQVVMFTHQDVSVWADLTYILWASGLRVTSAWNIATETESGGLKNGNYVKGTVLLVLRKQKSEETAYLDELYPEVEEEVKRQIDSMKDLDDKEDPNFTDADYLLAAYAASLKVLTSYKNIEDINVNYELSKGPSTGEESAIERIINEAIKIAYDYSTPSGFDSFIWKTLISEERFYIKGLDFEKDNIYKLSAYQEIARGFGVKEYTQLLGNKKANQTRLKTAKEFDMKGITINDKFGNSSLRNVLAALFQSIKSEDTIKGLNWLKNEVPDYWNQRSTILEFLKFIITLGHYEHMSNWEEEAHYARLLVELVKNDGV
ncbi:anti-phage-associated DUF1156 domain-containing protein [Virgibacillus byunsanensis]|uniref:Anti-phage-associated DUF1156 domain-containing protein n=1 Tax=Virgibacillus byunsanensis TaxID=570945 RepID=A0ABW3LSF2_9BACI